MTAISPVGVRIRAPVLDDAAAVADLINACALAVGDAPDCTISRIRNDWNRPRFNLGTDAWIAEDVSRRIVGYEDAWISDDAMNIGLDGYVHPDALGRGIGICLLRTAGEWAAPRAIAGTIVRASVDGTNANAHQLFEGEGFELVRQFWRMEIELREPPSVPVWPAGLAVRAFVPKQDARRLYATVQSAMADHWGWVPDSYEEWTHHHDDFDPALCLLAVEGDEIAGTAICTTRGGDGWVNTLAVRRPWRQRGLGLALLLSAFAMFHLRGIQVVGLGVDAQSLTGATRLYERAGMHVRVRYDTFEKTIDPITV